MRTLHILKKGCEDIQEEWKAQREDMLLLVNKSIQVSCVSPLPVCLGPKGPKLSVTGLVQAPMQNTD